MKRWAWLLGIVGTLVALTVVATYGGTASGSGPQWTPPDHTIVEVTGNKRDGFEIEHYDGSELFPPTDSEARAECLEYDTRVAQVRCWTEVKTWYRDLGDLKRALRYARS